MAGEKITGLPNQADVFGGNDLMLISKEIAPNVFESQKIGETGVIYNSGTKYIPDLDDTGGAFGIKYLGANYSNISLRAKITVINRIVTMEGLWILPLSSTADGQTLVANYQQYDNATNSQYPWLYEGLDGGFERLANGNARSLNPILPTELCPTLPTIVAPKNIMFRSIKVGNGFDSRYALQAYNYRTVLLPDGRVNINGVRGLQGFGSVPLGYPNRYDRYSSKLNAGDVIADYENTRFAFDGLGNFLGDPVPDSSPTPKTSPITIDATETMNWGGFFLDFKTQYVLDPLLPMTVIRDAVNLL